MSNCNCYQTPCTCTYQCPPDPCVDGCVDDVKTNCVQLSADLQVCTDGPVIAKGTNLTTALEALKTQICEGVTITTSDIYSKVSATDTTASYLNTKLTTNNSITKTITSPSGNEHLNFIVALSTQTGDNILQLLSDGLYVAPQGGSGGSTLSEVFSTTVDLTITPISGGNTLKADVKLNTTALDQALVDNGGLYVPKTVIPPPIIVAGGISQEIINTTSLLGSTYTITSTIKKDLTSTAPWSIGPNGLKIDCCSPAYISNTPLAVSSLNGGLIAITSGVDNHTLSLEVKRDPSLTNALTISSAGIYVAAAGTALATTINTSNTIEASLVSSNTYSLAVKKSSLGSNNILQLLSDGLYVPQSGCDLPYNLHILNDGTNYIAEFDGDGSTNTSYQVQAQGTTGSPLTWVTIAYTGASGSNLRYNIQTVAANVGSGCGFLSVRVRRICSGPIYSNWTTAYIDPSVIPNIANSDGTLVITTNPADCNQLLLNQPTTACPIFTPSGFQFTDSYSVNINSGLAVPNVNLKHVQWQMRVNTTGFGGTGLLVLDGAKVTTIKSLVPIKDLDVVEFRFKPFAPDNKYSQGSWSAWYSTSPPTGMIITDLWTPLPSGSISGTDLTFGTGVNTPYYKISSDKKHMYFRGRVIYTHLVSANSYHTITNATIDLSSLTTLLDASTDLKSASDRWLLDTTEDIIPIDGGSVRRNATGTLSTSSILTFEGAIHNTSGVSISIFMFPISQISFH